MYDQLAEIAIRMEQQQSGPQLGHLLPHRVSRTRRLTLGLRTIADSTFRSVGGLRSPRRVSKYPLFAPTAGLVVSPLVQLASDNEA